MSNNVKVYFGYPVNLSEKEYCFVVTARHGAVTIVVEGSFVTGIL